VVLASDVTEPTIHPSCPPRPVDTSGRLPILHVAAGALVDADGRVLIARRPARKAMAGLWELPGGKVESGEVPEAALARELFEELGIDVCVSCMQPFTFASHSYETFHLVMPVFLIRRWDGHVQALTHEAIAWVRPARLSDYPMPAADGPIVSMLQDFL